MTTATPQPTTKLAKRARREAFAAWCAEPETLSDLCDWVADGSMTLVDIARHLGCNYGWLHAWLHDEVNPDRLKAYTAACAARDSCHAESVVGQLHNLANLDIRDAYDESGDLLPIHQLPLHMAKAITSIDTTVSEKGDVTKKVRFADRGAMVGLGGRRGGLFRDKVELTGKDGDPLVMSLVADSNELLAKIRPSGGGGKA